MAQQIKSMYKFFHFHRKPHKGKTSVWECHNNRSDGILGNVRWYGPWRQYCFFPEQFSELVFSVGCLKDICHFTEQLRPLDKEQS